MPRWRGAVLRHATGRKLEKTGLAKVSNGWWSSIPVQSSHAKEVKVAQRGHSSWIGSGTMSRKVCHASGQQLPKGRSERKLSGSILGVDSGVASLKAMSSPASASCANRTDQKGRKKRKKKKRRLWTTDANRLQITVNLKNMRHLRRAFQLFCASSHPSYKCYMLENLAFFHNSSKTPDDADIANRKHYSAPAGALTMFSNVLQPHIRVWVKSLVPPAILWIPPMTSNGVRRRNWKWKLLKPNVLRCQKNTTFGGRQGYSSRYVDICRPRTSDEPPGLLLMKWNPRHFFSISQLWVSSCCSCWILPLHCLLTLVVR